MWLHMVPGKHITCIWCTTHHTACGPSTLPWMIACVHALLVLIPLVRTEGQQHQPVHVRCDRFVIHVKACGQNLVSHAETWTWCATAMSTPQYAVVSLPVSDLAGYAVYVHIGLCFSTRQASVQIHGLFAYPGFESMEVSTAHRSLPRCTDR